MTRHHMLRKLANEATRPIEDFMHQPLDPAAARPEQETAARVPAPVGADLFVWFEDTSRRQRDGRRGIAGLPECLLPTAHRMSVLERKYTPGHLHLLSAVRIRCSEKVGERIAAIYTAALSVGTIAWIGTGSHYERAWRELYP